MLCITEIVSDTVFGDQLSLSHNDHELQSSSFKGANYPKLRHEEAGRKKGGKILVGSVSSHGSLRSHRSHGSLRPHRSFHELTTIRSAKKPKCIMWVNLPTHNTQETAARIQYCKNLLSGASLATGSL